MDAVVSKEFEGALDRFRSTLIASGMSDAAKREAMDLACAAVEATRVQSENKKRFRALVQPAGDSDRLKLAALLDLMVSEVGK